MIYRLSLASKPFSVNNYYYATKKIKTKEARAWEAEITKLLQPHTPLLDMAAYHQRKGGVFKVELTFEYPISIFYNSANEISSKTMDLSNVEKNVIDRVFGDYMSVNDKHIVELVSRKAPGSDYKISVQIELI